MHCSRHLGSTHIAERRGICSGGMQILIVPRVCCDTVLLLLVIGSPCCRVGAAFTPHVAAVAVSPHIPLAFPVALSRTIEGVAGIFTIFRALSNCPKYLIAELNSVRCGPRRPSSAWPWAMAMAHVNFDHHLSWCKSLNVIFS